VHFALVCLGGAMGTGARYLLGGFTTYSAFAYESLRLAAAGSWGSAVLYVSLTTVLCFAACLLGIGAARLMAG